MSESAARARKIAAVAAVFVAAFAARWTMVEGLTGDDHYTLWKAVTFLKGDRPFVDFVDLGDPLYWGVSTLAQALVGYRVVGEVLLGAALVAFAVALAFHLAWRASGSAAIALVLTTLAVFVVKRELYSYPKIFLYPLGLWLGWRYIDKPTHLRAFMLALGVAVAFGYRHDHGAYIGVGAAAACLAAHWGEGPRRVAYGWLRVGVALILLLSPYFILVQANEGIVSYFRERIRLARDIDATSRRAVWFTVDPEAPSDWVTIEPPAPGRVIVEWTPDVDADARLALERRYSLANREEYEVLDGRVKWEYALADVSAGNIRAIVEDLSVFDTGLIDREDHRVLEESWFVRLQRVLPPLRMTIAPRLWHAENAGVLLHYVSMALPFIMLLMIAMDWTRGRSPGQMVHAREKMFAAGVLAAVAYPLLMRRTGYFAEHVVATTVLGACVIGHISAAARLKPQPARLVSGLAAGVVLVVTAFAAITYGNVAGTLAGMDTGLRGVWNQSVRTFQSFSTSPPIDAYAPPGTTGDRGLIRYIYECTRPDDRVWILTDLFTFPYYAERKVVGHIYWKAGLRPDPEYQQRMIAKVDASEVPLIVALGGARPLEFLEGYPLVHEYAARRYTHHHTVPDDSGQAVFWIVTDDRRTPTGTYELLGLPCFR